MSALSLLVLGVLTNDHDAAFAANDLALFAHGLHRRSYFHRFKPFLSAVVHLLRQVIRPRVRSYGDISTVTLSPGRILMKFILSFPEICARIMCPFPMSTWNVVLGRASTTTPSTSIMSDFAKRYPSWSGWTTSRQAARVLRSSLLVIFSSLLIFSARRVSSAEKKSTCLRFFRFGDSTFLDFPSASRRYSPSTARTTKSLPLSRPALERTMFDLAISMRSLSPVFKWREP